MHHHHHHRRPRIAYDTNSNYMQTDLPMKILGVQSNKDESTDVTPDLKSLQEMIKIGYPLLVNESLTDGQEKLRYHVNKTQGRYYVTFETVKVSQEGKEFKAFFRKGYVDVKYEALTEIRPNPRCKFIRQTKRIPRPLTQHEIQIIMTIVREKIFSSLN
ncbi:hypothetical protein TVAGG3_0336270 [Trichomonas vaginalis G3]|nr:hypothetical protein TVAGG3_0336270 [Trichomonas vaginalis G3]KAI5530293.1 hypothetical protein TVAGG3_0336270 [Trichomonas vaginalis G3]